jgi:hypothetical protein
MDRRQFTALGLASVVSAAVGCSGTEPERSTPAPSMTTPPRPPNDPPDHASTSSAPDPADTDGPVVAEMDIEHVTFDGFRAVRAIPAQPVGLVFVFHGSGGSADFALKIETIDVLNELWRRGFGFAATESTDRARKQWDNNTATPTSNADLARLVRLHDEFIAAGPVTDRTPVYAIGMSNGSGFATVWSEAMRTMGRPIAAVGKYMAGVPGVIADNGGVTVPTFMVVGTNDSPDAVERQRRDRDRIERTTTPIEYHELTPSALTADRFLRVPGMDLAAGEAVLADLRAGGFVDDTGRLAVDPSELAAATVSTSPGLAGDVEQQVKAVFAMHQMNAARKQENADFFERHNQ